MLNQLILVGRLVENPQIEEKEGKKYSSIKIAIPRSHKNENGEYDTDIIECTLWNGIAENLSEYCKKGDVLGIKGRIETNNIIVAEKVTFLSSKSNNE